MFGIANNVGRLVETSASSFTSPEEVAAYNARFREISRRIAAPLLIVCADFRRLRTLTPAIADRYGVLLTAHNLRIERSAVLCAPEHTEACSQLERVVGEANNARRRAFREPADVIEFLGEVLTDDERDRLIDSLQANRRQ